MPVLGPTTFDAGKPHSKNTQIEETWTKKKVSISSRIKNAAKESIPIALGVAGLEAVILFSFSSLDGLFFIISTLTSGTSIYVLNR